VDVDGTQLDVEATFCYLGDMSSAGGGCDLGQVQKAVANPHFKAHLFRDTWQGVHSLCSVNYAPWQ